MLTELHIQDFAIIDKLDIQFDSGLITFTGETGAGKSIIVDAVETLLGGRAESTMVRSGSEYAIVEGVFRIDAPVRNQLHSILVREELFDDSDYVTLGREIRTAGRNIARVNGRVVNTGLLRELGEYLVDVHGQSEHLSLLRVSSHLGLLDRYATTKPNLHIQESIDKYSKLYVELNAVRSELNSLRQQEQNAAKKAEALRYQIDEIEASRLKPGEDNELLEERNRLSNAEGLANLAQEALLALDEGNPESPAATDLLGQAMHALSGLVRLDPSQSQLYETMQTLFESASELASELRRYIDGIEFNPKRLDRVEERLVLIQTLKRKYGESIPSILEFAARAKAQLEEITHAEERIESLEVKEKNLIDELARCGQELSIIRHAASEELNKEIEAELVDLHMEGARFMVELSQHEDPQEGIKLPNGRQIAYYATGIEKVEFLIAPNPGEGFKPLAKIASGGETSRLMLALKNVLAQADEVPTLIFDEIDQGIGGRIGAVVGKKLHRLGHAHQVLCVTHLPQLAAYGNQHYHVEKRVQGERTITKVKSLQDEDRLFELAQMIGSISDGTLQSARELVQTVAKDTATE